MNTRMLEAVSNVIPYVEMDVVCMVVLALLLVKGQASTGLVRIQRLFSFMLVFAMVFFVFDILWVLCDNAIMPFSSLAGRWAFSLAVRTLYWLSGVGLAFSAAFYFEANQDTTMVGDMRRILFMATPLAVAAVLLVANLATGFLFTVDVDGDTYTRGPAFVVMPLAALLYLLLAAIRSLRSAYREENFAERSRFVSYAVFPVFVIVGEVAQMYFWQFPLLCVGITLAALNLCLDTLRNMVSIDQLTQLNNRTQFARSLTRRLGDGQDAANLYFLALDVDLFKQINDTYGHVEGDQALWRVACALRNAVNAHDPHGLIARYGGDEFVAVVEAEDDQQVEELCGLIRQELEREDDAAGSDYRISVSIGWARWKPGVSSVNQFMELADAKLYEQKRARAAARTLRAAG